MQFRELSCPVSGRTSEEANSESEDRNVVGRFCLEMKVRSTSICLQPVVKGKDANTTSEKGAKMMDTAGL